MRIVPQHLFEAAFNSARESSARIKDATSPFEHSKSQSLYVLADDDQSGFAVRPDGELVYVFSTVNGRGGYLVRTARQVGATHLDCFDGFLVDLYSRHGFQRVTSLPNWTPGEPDVVYMAVPGHFDSALVKAESA